MRLVEWIPPCDTCFDGNIRTGADGAPWYCPDCIRIRSGEVLVTDSRHAQEMVRRNYYDALKRLRMLSYVVQHPLPDLPPDGLEHGQDVVQFKRIPEEGEMIEWRRMT